MHINPGIDWINRKSTNAILLYLLVCFVYRLSLSVQMSLLEIICLQLKGNATFCMLDFLYLFSKYKPLNLTLNSPYLQMIKLLTVSVFYAFRIIVCESWVNVVRASGSTYKSRGISFTVYCSV